MTSPLSCLLCDDCGMTLSMSAPEPGHILFVVMATEDVYSSRSEWTVAAYTDKVLAEQHAKKALAWHEMNLKRFDNDWSISVDAEPNPYDISPNSTRYDRAYGVYPLFVHFDPEQFRSEVQVLTDKARELGYLP